MVNQLNLARNLKMSSDYLSQPSLAINNNHNHNNNNNIDNTNKPLSRSSSSSSIEYEYKYSKNKHLSQRIGKKKKNRKKQLCHKKKQFTKIKQQNKYKNTKKNNKNNNISNKSLSSSSKNNYKQNKDVIFEINNDRHYIQYPSTQHEQNKYKNKKIQVINNNEPLFYYYQSVNISNNNLNKYNYNKNKNNCNSSPIIVVQSPIPQMSASVTPSPMLLSTNLSSTNNLTPLNLSPTPNNSPLLHSLSTAKNGEVLLGYEESIKSLMPLNSLCVQKSNCQLSVLSDACYSDYIMEGNINKSYNHKILSCLNVLNNINNDINNDVILSNLDINKLNKMEMIIKQLKDKIIINKNKEEKKNDNDNDNNQLISDIKLIECTTSDQQKPIYYD